MHTLTLASDTWSWMYCSEYFNVIEYLVWFSHETKKVDPKKWKNYHHWNTYVWHTSGDKRLSRWKFQEVGAGKERLC